MPFALLEPDFVAREEALAARVGDHVVEGVGVGVGDGETDGVPD